MTSVDVLVVAALQEEYDAARAVGTDRAAGRLMQWRKHDRDSLAPYETIEITSPGGPPLSVALARPTRMGGRSISTFTTTLAERLHPRCVAMCGVCAGNPDVVALGDVVVAELVYEFDEGKQAETGFFGDHRQLLMDDRWIREAQGFSPAELPSHGPATYEEAAFWFLERLLAGEEPRDHPARARYFPDQSWRAWLRRMEAAGLITPADWGWALTDSGRSHINKRLYGDVDGPDRLPFAVTVAPMASGNAVIKDGATWAHLSRAGVRTVAALEMEAATVATVARQQQVPHWLIVKGVMDHADHRKGDRYKRFATRASAEVLYALLTRLLSPKTARPPVCGPRRPGRVRNLVLVAGLVAALSIASLVWHHLTSPPPDSVVIHVMDQEVAAGRSRDIRVVEQIYASDAIVTDAACLTSGASQTWRGLGEIKARYRDLPEFVSLNHVGAHVVWMPDDWQASRAEVTADTVAVLRPTSASPTGRSITGRESWTFAKVGDRWIIQSFTYNVCLSSQ